MYPILFEPFGFPISTFGVMMAIGFLVSAWIVGKRLGEYGLDPEHSSTILIYAMLGGVLGCALVLPFQGAETGTMNQTFSEVTFAFRTTPFAMAVSIAFASVLGFVGGLIPAWRASRLTPTQALRRG